ncbi:MAG: sulfotransferase [Kordiimonadaceae bacterium]|nr:sulfotransferase [Kordiimonadaceae bacterium]
MSNQMPRPILVTGCYRSGTTLVEKILNMHPSITIASQPFPILYFLVKEHFNQSIGTSSRYPLYHLFKETTYTAKQFNDFLLEYILDEDALHQLAIRMGTYTNGLWTPEILTFLNKLTPGTFFSIYSQLNRLIAGLFPAANQHYVGSKEVLIEEYISPLAIAGAKNIVVIRDPRAMITSLNFSERDNLTGNSRPILYSLRAWRKSVALATTAAQQGRACMIRYEDLVLNNRVAIKKITDFLAVTPYAINAFDNGIIDQHGKQWSGNSSFSDQKGISKASLEAYIERLTPLTQHFIEAVCAPEMRLLGYKIPSSSLEQSQALSNYRDPFESAHHNFPTNYSNDENRLKQEKMRLNFLKNGCYDKAAQREWFITTETYSALRAHYQ